MFFKKKKKVIKLEMYAPVGQLIDMLPPVLMKDDIPAWYDNIPADAPGKTVKHCPGFKDLYSKGISIPLWADYNVETGVNKITNITWPKKSGLLNAGGHNLQQQAPSAWPDYVNIKFESPWRVWCDEPIPFIFLQPVWNQKDPQQFTTVPGVTEFRYQHQINIITLWKTNGIPRQDMLKAGTTIAQLIPLTDDRPIEISLHTLTQDVYNEKFVAWDYSLGKASYMKLKNIINKNKK